MSDSKFPTESDSQRIGQMAILAFNPCYPANWRPIALEGDNDYGKDYWIQVSDNGKMSRSFFLQLKSSNEFKNGKSKKLSDNGEYYSQKLKVSTVNKYYCEMYPVMLAFVDLCQNDNPRKCKVYYSWLDENKLKKTLASKSDQETSIFRIPTKNILNEDIDVLSFLNDYCIKHKVLNNLWDHLPEESVNKDKVEIVNAMSERISLNPSIIHSIIEDDNDPWINAPAGSIASKLRNISSGLDSYIIDTAREQLNKISTEIKNANKHEQAEYHYLKGQYLSMTTDNPSLEHYEKATNCLPENEKYFFAYLENKINAHYSDEIIIQETIKELDGKDCVKAKIVKAKALALLKNEDSLIILDQIPEEKLIILKPLCLLLLEKHKECCDFIKSKLNDSVSKDNLRMQLFLVRSLFILGYGKERYEANKVISFRGTSEMNIPELTECWEFAKSSWELAAKLGYPIDIDYIIDISSILGMFFDDIEAIYPHLRNFADKYPSISHLQQALLTISTSINDFKTSEKLFKRVDPDDIFNIEYKITYEYEKNQYDEVARLTHLHLDELFTQKPLGYDAILLRGVECAEISAMADEKEAILKKLEQLPDSDGLMASYYFFESVNKSQLNGEKALEKLYKTFKNGCHHHQVLYLLLHNLRPGKQESALRILEVIEAIEKQQPLHKNDFDIYANALIKLEKWNDLLSKVEEQIIHYRNNIKLLSTKALVLDQLGETPKSLEILSSLQGKSQNDRYTLQISLNVFMRCGFFEQAKKLLIKMLSQAENKKDKLEIIRMLYGIEMRTNPSSPKLIEYCFKYGDMADQDDIEEEGIFLLLAYPLIIKKMCNVEQIKVKDVHQRIEKYTKKHPDSNLFRGIKMPVNATIGQLQDAIEKATGSVSRHEKLIECEGKIKSGEYNIPYSVRYNFLPNVCDLLHLWQITKQTHRKHTQYQLAISEKTYIAKKAKETSNKIPVIDEISLILLNDLELLPYLFDVFSKIVISKDTITRLLNWGQYPFSINNSSAREITDTLKSKIDQIIQPSCKHSDIFHLDVNQLLEYGDILKTNKDYILYSDDGLFRCCTYGKKYKTKGMTTIDLLEILKSKGILSGKNFAEKYAKLFSWNITGVGIRFVDILMLIDDRPKSDDSIFTRIKTLEANQDFTSTINALWTSGKLYVECLIDIGSLISICLDIEHVKFTDNMIAAIWISWYQRIMLIEKLSGAFDYSFLADSFNIIAYKLAVTIEKEKQEEIALRLWLIYKKVTNELLAGRMTGDSNYNSIRIIANRTVSILKGPIGAQVYKFVKSGIKDLDLDNKVYNQETINALIENNKRIRLPFLFNP